MKLVVLSDIHGSAFYAEKIEEIMKREKPEKLLLLGDLYYHGPRNPLPEGYLPMRVAEILNSYCDKIVAVRGNCDAEVDLMISKFFIEDEKILEWEGRKIFLSHGQNYHLDSWPSVEFDIMLYGHTHMGFIHEEKGKLFANPGSMSLPKNNTKHSYLTLENGKIQLKEVEGNVLVER